MITVSYSKSIMTKKINNAMCICIIQHEYHSNINPNMISVAYSMSIIAIPMILSVAYNNSNDHIYQVQSLIFFTPCLSLVLPADGYVGNEYFHAINFSNVI